MNSGNNHNVFNKIAVINDMTGFGRCALAVELPIISHMGIQCCPVPTSIFSNHTAYESFYFQDYTEHMEAYTAEWKKLGLLFDGILTGFYGSARQIDMVEQFIKDFSNEDTIVIVDPIMGDNGETYATYNVQMCEKMKELARMADIITPNLTELCLLVGESYVEGYDYDFIKGMCDRLAQSLKKNCKIVVTGIKRGNYLVNYIYCNGEVETVQNECAGDTRCGTGDVFAAIIAADAVRGVGLKDSVKRAADFVSECIQVSDKYQIPKTDGVCFEKLLYKL